MLGSEMARVDAMPSVNGRWMMLAVTSSRRLAMSITWGLLPTPFAGMTQALAVEAPRLIRLGTGADTLPKLAELPGPERDALLSAVYDLGNLAP